MPEPRHWHIVLYDVSDPGALRRVHRTLKAWGRPVQFSAFLVRCSARERERLRFELVRLIDRNDRLMLIRLCETCAGRVTFQGREIIALTDDPPPFHEA